MEETGPGPDAQFSGRCSPTVLGTLGRMGRRSEWGRWASYGHCLADNLRTLRTMRGLSQDRLAELSGLSRNQISNIERNENNSTHSADPVLSTVYRLARALHVPPVALLPAPDRLVEEICPAEGVAVDVVWPSRPEDTMAFDAAHLYGRSPDDGPTFDPATARELDIPAPAGRRGLPRAVEPGPAAEVEQRPGEGG